MEALTFNHLRAVSLPSELIPASA
ncbi:uncharacterized protein G2W53_028821 [Senna tora]|uniref:Uncharacterized protein n=1 Tax=Senna tora TaxID=362788 RepID=A0A834WA46_9FABA|nr:uncharacterized protein G2W53_028821 [Senna tora]